MRLQLILAGVVLVCVNCSSESASKVQRPAAEYFPALPEAGPLDRYSVKVWDDISIDDVVLAHKLGAFEILTKHVFIVTLSQAQLHDLLADPAVRRIQQDSAQLVEFATQAGAPWALARVGSVAPSPGAAFNYFEAGYGVHVYIIDTGLAYKLPEFGGRASLDHDVLAGSGDPSYDPADDCGGHGTGVAGVVGSSTYGVAKGAYLHGVRVKCSTRGGPTDVAKGLAWVLEHRKDPAVVVLALGAAGDNAEIKDGIDELANAGVPVVGGVPNDSTSTPGCNYWPANVPTAIVAASTNAQDVRVQGAGACVDLLAPGANVETLGADGSPRILSGSTISAGYVGGALALYKSAVGETTVGEAEAWLKDTAIKNVVSGLPSGTPNLMLYLPLM